MGRSGRSLRLHGDEDDERVVYYDLDAGSHSRNLLLSPDAAPAPSQARAKAAAAKAAAEGGGSQIFPRQQQPLFNLDDSGDEAEEENPFATLIQQQQQKAKPVTTNAAPSCGAAAKDSGNSVLQAETAVPTASDAALAGPPARGKVGTKSSGGSRGSILKHSQRESGKTLVSKASGSKKLGFEAADSRPARWSTRKPSAMDTNNRRKSLSAIQKRRSQLEASSAKRRKSMPSASPSPHTALHRLSVDDCMDSSFAVSKKRSLSDVLQRATILSQQHNSANDMCSNYQLRGVQGKTDASLMDDDAILDTDHQMQAEPFAPQIFSPTKTALSGTTAGRKAKSDATVPKIRGGIGVVIRKAVRRSNRDLTLLRSHGQHLLPQQTSHSSPTGTIGAVESIQDRAFIVLRLKQRHENVPHFASYEAYIQEVGAKLKGSTADKIKDQNSVVVEALFQPQVAEYLKLCPGKLVRIYEPLHFVTEQRAVGSTSKPKWFLLSTQLAEATES